MTLYIATMLLALAATFVTVAALTQSGLPASPAAVILVRP